MKNFIFILVILIIFSLVIVFQVKKNDILKINKSNFQIYENQKPTFIENSNEIYVLFNEKSQKYHKIDCEYAKIAHNFKRISLKEAQKLGTPCKICFSKSQNSICYKNLYFIQDAMEFVSINPKLYLKPSYTRVTPVNQLLLKSINEAKNTIDIAMYEFDNDKMIINALKNAQNRGVKIRIIVDNSPNKDDFNQKNEKIGDFFELKTDKNCEANAIMHNKFLIVDNNTVITGSTNITHNDMSGFNCNNLIKIRSISLARAYEEQFEDMFNGHFHRQKTADSSYKIPFGKNKIWVYFSPQAKIIDNALIPQILNAKKSIYIPIFFLTEDNFVNALMSAHKRGVAIKIILDATAGRNPSTKHEKLRKAGIKVKVENWAGKMHQKAMIVDDTVIIGSMNFSNSGNLKNDENCLIIKNIALANQYQKHFLELYNSIPDKCLYQNPAPEGADSPGSCSDGIDNDYNGLIDAKDKKCQNYKQ